MGKKKKEIYAPGELGKVRDRLGYVDNSEAKRMVQLLGGEVGFERSEEKSPLRHRLKGRGANVPSARRAVTHVNDEDFTKKADAVTIDPHDDPSVPVKASYLEWVKMDKYAGQVEFEIKTFNQFMQSVFSFFSPPPDYLNPKFVTNRMNEYYQHLENLVISTRNLFPRNNLRRDMKLKRASDFAYAVLDTIRQWNIEQISKDLTRLQARSRAVKSADFSDILRIFYRPLFILEKLDMEYHIAAVYKLLYRINYLENPIKTKEKKHAALVQTALKSLRLIRIDIRFLLYPLLMKLLSDRWFPYELFFSARKKRYLAFIEASDADQIQPMDISTEIKRYNTTQEEDEEEDEEEEKEIRFTATEAEQRALDKGLQTLEVLFPKAGWDRLPQYPDLYPYFRDVFSLTNEYVLIAPTDPIMQVMVFAYILRELFIGLRYVSFGMVTYPDGKSEWVNGSLGPIIDKWHYAVETGFDREYLPRLSEYCRIMESNSESHTSSYAKRLLNELQWIKRLYFLPYYKFETLLPPPFQKYDIPSLYIEIRHLRRSLTAVAAGIERGNKMGGAEKKTPCEGIDNPWDRYTFQVPNPLSKRLDLLLGEKKQNNASLIFFTLAVTVVADTFINNGNSWAYTDRPEVLFRSINGEGLIPSPGEDDKVDAEALFKQSLKKEGSWTFGSA
ncbi:MAG: hypothetical protein LBE17_01895 [Treponema sp.]|jgi:hypothetical protein|nr:hypothetical protein [Treponema sp.]